jgi:hypothetical protein
MFKENRNFLYDPGLCYVPFQLFIFHTQLSKTTPCIAILNKKNVIFLFYKIREPEGKTDPVWGFLYQWEGKMWVKGIEGEYGAYMYTYM